MGNLLNAWREKDGAGLAMFKVGGKKRIRLMRGSDVFLVNGIVDLADGTKHAAVLSISEDMQGKLFGASILSPFGVIFQPDWEEQLGKSPKELYPYKYKVTATLHCENIYVGEDGWSIEAQPPYKRKPKKGAEK